MERARVNAQLGAATALATRDLVLQPPAQLEMIQDVLGCDGADQRAMRANRLSTVDCRAHTLNGLQHRSVG